MEPLSPIELGKGIAIYNHCHSGKDLRAAAECKAGFCKSGQQWWISEQEMQ